MPAPAVSHEKWTRADALCYFVMDGQEKQVEKLGFKNQLKAIRNDIEDMDESLTSKINDMSDGTYYHPALSTPASPCRRTIYPDEQQRHHRPSISAADEDRLDELVSREYPSLPVEGLGFDDKVGMLFDKYEKYWNCLECYIAKSTKSKA